ncbi:MAG: hypothetical protein IJ121_05645 [Eubacterium sp.]|nr:hypothetical protein [Eubacterium sp.]
MSSVNWKKLKYTQSTAMLRHAARYDDTDQDVQYKNPFLDKSRTHLNSRLSHSSKYETGKEAAERLRNRVKEIDAVEPPQRVRKDRVTAISFTVSAPEGLQPDQEEQFFNIVYRHLTEKAGGPENISPMYIHRDETHEYFNVNNTGKDNDKTGTIVTSRVHAHCTAIPYVPGKGVNAKTFMTRSTMRELNRTIDKSCKEELGIPFLTGARQPYGRSVEELQAASEQARRRMELEEIEKKKEQSKAELKEIEKEIEKTKSRSKAEKEKASAEKTLAEEQIKSARESASRHKEEAEKAKAESEKMKSESESIRKKMEELKSRYSSLATKYNSLVKTFNILLTKATKLGIAVGEKIHEIHEEQWHDL